MLRHHFAQVTGLRTAQALEQPEVASSSANAPQHEKLYDKSNRYSGVPAIPSDIGYHTGRKTGGKTQEGGITGQITSNPAVVVGMGLTTVALLGMMRRSFIGDRIGAQKFMQYRIMAQFFTVSAMCAGALLLGITLEPTNKQ